MFGDKGNSKPQSRIDCLIGAGTTIEGNITFTGGLRVDGVVRGDVISADAKPGTLVLSEQAQIEGVIHVSHAVINGSVIGAVHAVE
jgi:cytoskeletal protein CcmA (bactofilin family)